MIGFETIGNAILICYDGLPILVTDPWLSGGAYFGSWTFSHSIPEAQLEAARSCEYAWISHGHPDHLNLDSLRTLKAKRILLPDHVGSRVARELKEQGFHVYVLKDRTWYPLSRHIRVLCIADYNQDGILLVDINGRLIANLNDSSDHGWGRFVANTIRQYETSFLLRLSGYGDADMINIFDDSGRRIVPFGNKRPIGKEIAKMVGIFPARFFIPFSSMHKYQRADSSWANEYTAALGDYVEGFDSKNCELLPAFIRWNCETDTYEAIAPPENPRPVLSPKEFGDDWTALLEAEDVSKLSAYFKGIEHLGDCFDYINFRVGGKDNIIEIGKRHFRRAITFEVPRNSMMQAIEYRVFDDLLIGNFMRTMLHGDFAKTGLYPDFSPYVAKYADNGMARTKDELRDYFEQYRRRAPADFLKAQFERGVHDVIRRSYDPDSSLYRAARRTYHLCHTRVSL
jgi:hypothetical protein